MITFLILFFSNGLHAALLCGTALHNMSSLQALGLVHLPAGTPCTAVQCADNPLQPNTLPWDVYFAFCQATANVPNGSNCGAAATCMVWPGDSCSLGQFSTVTWSDNGNNSVIMTATGGTVANGIARQMTLTISCPTTGKSDPFPLFLQETDATLQYAFSWNHVAACYTAPTPSPVPTCGYGLFFESRPAPHCEECHVVDVVQALNGECPVLASTICLFFVLPVFLVVFGAICGFAIARKCSRPRCDDYTPMNNS